MPITDNDIRFRASERMTDFADGGGRMSDVIILDGVDNNVFPDITDLERLTGKVSLRKVYAGAFNADTDTFLSSHVVLDIPPTDNDTSALIFAYGGIATERAEALAALNSSEQSTFATLQVNATWASGYTYVNSSAVAATWTGGGSVITLPASSGNLDITASFTSVNVPQIGTLVILQSESLGTLLLTVTDRTVMAHTGGGSYSGANTITVAQTLPAFSPASLRQPVASTVGPVFCYGVATAPGIVGSGSTSVTVESTWSQGNNLPSPALQIVPVLRTGDALLIHHTEAMAPAARANSDVVNTGRTGLARLRVIGSTGVEHARFTDGQAAPVGVGCTADLTAGTVTFTDVSGMAQPLIIEHRIEEMALATTVTLTTVGLNRALSREYPAGTRVSSLLMVGDLQGRATAGFAQQAWTGVWSDAIIGGTPVGDFNDASHPIACTNAGAVTERWAVIFTNTTSYRVIGEALGEIGTGNTGADYEPVNPVTGQPYFSLAAVGWGAGWAAGNVYRFNTIGAVAPVWALRCVAPSTPSGDDSVTLELRGYVNT